MFWKHAIEKRKNFNASIDQHCAFRLQNDLLGHFASLQLTFVSFGG